MAKKKSNQQQSKDEIDREIKDILSGKKKVTFQGIFRSQKPLIWQIIAYLKLSKGVSSSQLCATAKEKVQSKIALPLEQINLLSKDTSKLYCRCCNYALSDRLWLLQVNHSHQFYKPIPGAAVITEPVSHNNLIEWNGSVRSLEPFYQWEQWQQFDPHSDGTFIIVDEIVKKHVPLFLRQRCILLDRQNFLRDYYLDTKYYEQCFMLDGFSTFDVSSIKCLCGQIIGYQYDHLYGGTKLELGNSIIALACDSVNLDVISDSFVDWYLEQHRSTKEKTLSFINRHQEAIASYDREIAKGTKEAEIWYYRGESYFALNNCTAALESYKKACSLQLKNGYFRYAKGLALYRLKRFKQAPLVFHIARLNAPDFADAQYFYVLTLEKIDFYYISKYALEDIEEAIILEENPSFICCRGRIMRKLGEYESALASYDWALELDPDHIIALLNKGFMLCEDLNRPDEALKYFERAIELEPDFPLAWYNKGNALYKLGNYEAAIACHDRATRLLLCLS